MTYMIHVIYSWFRLLPSPYILYVYVIHITFMIYFIYIFFLLLPSSYIWFVFVILLPYFLFFFFFLFLLLPPSFFSFVFFFCSFLFKILSRYCLIVDLSSIWPLTGSAPPDLPLSRLGGLRDSRLYSLSYDKYIQWTGFCFGCFEVLFRLVVLQPEHPL